MVLLGRDNRHFTQVADGIDQGCKTGSEVAIIVADQDFHRMQAENIACILTNGLMSVTFKRMLADAAA